jgi:hypothetical protein
MKSASIVLLGMAFLLTGISGASAEEAFIGMVKTVRGGATIERDGQRLEAVPGMILQSSDIVSTKEGGSVGLVFSDDTVITMGDNARIAIDHYVFEPKDHRLSFVVRMLQGMFSYVSGQIAKLSPESVRLAMPDWTIGVRGTHVLVKVD